MVDLYTKAILAVIALALVVLAGQGFVRPVDAQSRDTIQKVAICDGLGCVGLLPRINSKTGGIIGFSLAIDTGN